MLAVVDGDTFVAREGESLYLLKLRDVEAPELEQVFGAEARKRLAEWMLGRWTTVWPEKAESCVIPVRAQTLGGVDIAAQMLAEGFAWVGQSASEGLRRLETAARLDRVGLWREAEPEPPWEFRARRRMARKPEHP